ncbi:MAG: hypothetical protein EP332_08810 [Bacteroidetes bacterium]|nr:MAG: hypothetical protein EP332_08810 [Bacteroidota bacterium]
MEALLRQSLSEYTLPVEEQDWQDFLAFAAKKKSRRGGIWWALALTLLCCTGLLAYQYTQHKGSEETEHSSSNAVFVPETENGTTSTITEVEPQSAASPTDAIGTSASNIDSNLPVEPASTGSEQTPTLNIDFGQFPTPDFTQVTASVSFRSHSLPEFSRNNPISISSLMGLPGFISASEPAIALKPWPKKESDKEDKRPPFPINTLSVYFSYSQVFGQSDWSLNNGGEEFVHRQFSAALTSNSLAISGNGFELGFRLPLSTKPVLRNISLSGGFEYATREQRSNFEFYSSEFPVIDTANRIVAYIPDTFATLNQVGINQMYSSLSVPIQVQLARSFGNNLNLGLRAGVQFSRFQNTAQAQVDPITFEPVTTEKALQTYSLSYTFGFFGEYRVLRNWGVMLSVDRRYYRPIYQTGEYLNNQPKLFDTRFSIIRYL